MTTLSWSMICRSTPVRLLGGQTEGRLEDRLLAQRVELEVVRNVKYARIPTAATTSGRERTA